MSGNIKLSSGSNNISMGILSWLQVGLILLKLMELIKISWWQVFIPTYIGLGFLVVLFGFLLWVNEK